ncbi:MAG TPA: sulfatase, partial [Limnochordia bacterium]|nr:sulfatase [Limnochordia bacterium]
MKNAILISLDTLRADHLGCYGYARCTSPHLDAYAAGGVRFTQAYAQSIPTHPSHTTMFTGRDVMDHQIVRQGGKIDLDPRLPVLAQTLRDAGFYTAAADNLGRWFSRGFVDYEGYKWESEPDVPWRRGEAVNQTALRLLERCAEANAKGEPFFLFVHYWDAHTPYLPPPPFRELFYAGDPRSPVHDSMGPVLASPYFEDYFGAWLGDVTDIEWPKAQYDAGIAYLDACLAVFLRRLDELGLSDSTLVTIVGDHGEELDEHR